MAERVEPRSFSPWAPRGEIAPQTEKLDAAYSVRSNGSAGCYGGWEISYPVPVGAYACVRVTARLHDLPKGLDSVHAALVWDNGLPGLNWEPLLPVSESAAGVLYECLTPVPAQAAELVVRLCMAWSGSGHIEWGEPEILPADAPPPRRWRLAAGGGPLPSGERTLKTNTEAYLSFCREAAEKNCDLLCLPEVMLTTGLPSSAETLPEQAISIPGPEIEPFQEFCRDSGVVLCFSAWEREEERVHNTALLIDEAGEIVGKYRKVHLASPLEGWWGVTPGEEFGVFDVGDARFGMNICMDSSVAESARVPAMLGAEIICMPIMGDHRAVAGWKGGPSDFDLDRWNTIQRVRAMDNQVYMVISRNTGIGTGIYAPTGDILAVSGGSRRVVYADVDLSDLPRTWTHASFPGVTRWVRRRPTYGPLMADGVL